MQLGWLRDGRGQQKSLPPKPMYQRNISPGSAKVATVAFIADGA
jgi:hypothetical protein